MAGSDLLNSIDPPDFGARLAALVQRAQTLANSSPDARDLVPVLDELVILVEENPSEQALAVEAFLGLVVDRPDELNLGVPGAIEILEYAMHRLRWPVVRDAVTELGDSAPDWRVRRSAARVLEAFEDDWPGGEIYDLDVTR